MLQPIDARVVVSQATKQEQTESGIILPDTVSEQSATAQGEVLAVGPGSRSFSGELMAMDIKVGDTIIYQKFGGTEITHNGDELIILAEKDVLGNSVVGYDTAIKIAEAVQPIYKGEVEGITAADIDTDQLYIDKDVMAEASTDEETGTLTFPTEIDQDLLDDYIEGMVYYNYRNGQFYRKSGKQFIPIQQPES